MQKPIILICLLVLSLQWAVAQNSIKGIISDSDNNPLSDATIFIPELNKSTISNNNGEYRISNLPNGKIKIQISFLGYATVIETVFLKDKEYELNIALKETAITTEEVVVSGGYSSTQHDNAVKIDVLKLNTHLTPLSPNFTEILTNIPGVDMISKGSGVSKPVIRGLGMDNVLVLNNGVRFENYQYSDHHPLGIDEYGIANIEVIKGPASLLYGSDAIGGVINFLKEKPATIGKVVGDYNMQLFSNSLGVSNNIGIKGASKKFFGGLRAGIKTNADYLQGGGAFVPNSRFNELSLKPNCGFTSNLGIFKLFYDYNRQKLGLAEGKPIEEIASRGRKNEIWYEQMNNHLLSSQNKIFMNKYKLEINASLQSADLIHYAGIDTTEISMNLKTLAGEAKLYLPSNEKSEYIVGIQSMYQVNKNSNKAEEILLPDAQLNNYSAFALLQYTFFKKLKFQSGIRYDYKTISTESIGQISDFDYRPQLSKYYDSFSGSIGATYNHSEKLLIRANFASAYRTPNLAELTSNGIHEIRYELGNSSLLPQSAYESDLSMHYHLKDFTFDIAGFYNIINNYIYISPTEDTVASGIHIYKYMQSEAVLFGGETGFHFHPKKMKWLHLVSTFSTVTGKQIHSNNLPFIPANKIHTEIMAEKTRIGLLHEAFVKLNLLTAFKQNNPSPDENVTPGYSLLDFSIGASVLCRQQLIPFYISVNNLLDKKYIDHLSTLKEVGFYNPGRNITLTINIPFAIK
jgi:iron complex outermembrane recepter protein